MSDWTAEDIAKYDWYEATDEHRAAFNYLKVKNAESYALANQIREDVGARDIITAGGFMAGFTFDEPPANWRRVRKMKDGRWYYLPYRRLKADTELSDKIREIRFYGQRDFGAQFCSVCRVDRMATFMSAVFYSSGGRDYFGIPVGARPDEIYCDLTELTPVKLKVTQTVEVEAA